MILLENLTEEQQLLFSELMSTEPIIEKEPTAGGYTRDLKRTYENDNFLVEEIISYQYPPMDKAWGAMGIIKYNYYAK